MKNITLNYLKQWKTKLNTKTLELTDSNIKNTKPSEENS